MDNSGRPYRRMRGTWEREAAGTDEAECWRMHDQVRGQNLRCDGGQQGKRNQGGPYKASPKRGGLGPLGPSPAGFKGGHSPSQGDGFQWFPGPESGSLVREDNWRVRTQQQQQQQQWRRNAQVEGSTEDMGQRRGEDDFAQKPGECLGRHLSMKC